MKTGIDYELVDLIVFAAANLVNVLLAAMFLSRAWRRSGAARGLGWASMAAGLPILAAPALNAVGGRELVVIALPIPYAVHWIVELILDYVLKSGFRSTRLLGPYLGLFYLGQIGLMGYSFSIGREYGFATLFTYLLCLAATGYSYRMVGHGVPAGT